MKKIEVCLGVGMNQLFPEYITIEIPKEEDKESQPKKRGRKPKSKE